MGTILIQSDNVDDLFFLNELATRLGFKTKVDTPEAGVGNSNLENCKNSPEAIVEGVKRALQEVKDAEAGKIKLTTLSQLLDED